MRPFQAILCTGLLLTLGGLPSTALAQRAFGYRLTGNAGFSAYGKQTPQAYGVNAAVSHAFTPVVQADLELAYHHNLPITFPVLLSSAGSSQLPRSSGDLVTMLAGVDLHFPEQGRAVPFVRAAAGVGYLRAGALTAESPPGLPGYSYTYVVKRDGHTGAALRVGVGMGRPPGTGLGWEAGFYLLQTFMSEPDLLAEYTSTTFGLAAGLVY